MQPAFMLVFAGSCIMQALGFLNMADVCNSSSLVKLALLGNICLYACTCIFACPFTAGEEVVRGRPLFVLAPLIQALQPMMRDAAGVSSWQVRGNICLCTGRHVRVSCITKILHFISVVKKAWE